MGFLTWVWKYIQVCNTWEYLDRSIGSWKPGWTQLYQHSIPPKQKKWISKICSPGTLNSYLKWSSIMVALKCYNTFLNLKNEN